MNCYKKVINYQKRQMKDLYDLPLVHLCINFRSYLGINRNAMFRVMSLIRDYNSNGKHPEYRIREYILSREYYVKCYNSRPKTGHITYYNKEQCKYMSKHVFDTDCFSNINDLPF